MKNLESYLNSFKTSNMSFEACMRELEFIQSNINTYQVIATNDKDKKLILKLFEVRKDLVTKMALIIRAI